jgi:hypothetical protein
MSATTTEHAAMPAKNGGGTTREVISIFVLAFGTAISIGSLAFGGIN